MKKGILKIVCILLAAAFLLTGCDSADYEKAMELYEIGSYDEACAIFTRLSDYEDSADMALRCRYEKALKDYESGEYEQAFSTFAELGEYEDCQDLSQDCRYQMAVWLFDSEDYQQALSEFADLNDYEDSSDWVRRCYYQLGMLAMEEEDYQQARACFQAADGWEDSEELAKEIPGRILIRYLQDNGKLVYCHPDPVYTVTMSYNGINVINLDYLMEQKSDTVTSKTDVTIMISVDDPDAAVVGTYSQKINFMGMIAESAELAMGVLPIADYRYGDKMPSWQTYSFEGHDIYGKPTDYKVCGLLYVASNAPLERSFRAAEALFREHELGIMLNDIGFAALEE